MALDSASATIASSSRLASSLSAASFTSAGSSSPLSSFIAIPNWPGTPQWPQKFRSEKVLSQWSAPTRALIRKQEQVHGATWRARKTPADSARSQTSPCCVNVPAFPPWRFHRAQSPALLLLCDGPEYPGRLSVDRTDQRRPQDCSCLSRVQPA